MKANLQTPELQADAAGTPPTDTPETEPAVTDISVSDEVPAAEEAETEEPAIAEAVEESTADVPVLTPEEADAALKEKVESIPYSYHKKPLFDFVKRFFDILLSGMLLLLIWPVYLIIAICIKCDDGGKVFYRHPRLGRGGKEIRIAKFRSMKKDADKFRCELTPEQLKQYETEFKIDNDPRVTKIGNFLRKTSLDELPQVWDIFVGRLSIIGPRPIMEKESLKYYGKRKDLLSVKPGLTGYWQAYARNNVGYSDGKRQEMELFYVEKRSIWLDIKIFFKTIGSVLTHKGAK
ncbi:MAG: sugar transferase [Eubacteriales bacterium]